MSKIYGWMVRISEIQEFIFFFESFGWLMETP